MSRMAMATLLLAALCLPSGPANAGVPKVLVLENFADYPV